MKKKIAGMLVFTLLLATTASTVANAKSTPKESKAIVRMHYTSDPGETEPMI